MRVAFLFLLLFFPSCLPPQSAQVENRTTMHHPTLDLERWKRQFPLVGFEKQEGPRRFSTSEPGDPIDLWKASGRIISSPVDLAVTEQVRERTVRSKDVGTGVPVDIFVWAAGTPERPYLTKIGGTPHRDKEKPWPKSRDGKPMTFVVQFCFLDSKDIIANELPGDVMLVFFESSDGYFADGISVEWSHRELAEPLRQGDCPAPSFIVPELAGVRYRALEYPAANDVFAELGHYQHWLLATTQSTKIGKETWFIQRDPRGEGETLLCTFNSLQPDDSWPFTNTESFSDASTKFGLQAGNLDAMMFGDVGCFYFLLDEEGEVRWEFDCY